MSFRDSTALILSKRQKITFFNIGTPRTDGRRTDRLPELTLQPSAEAGIHGEGKSRDPLPSRF